MGDIIRPAELKVGDVFRVIGHIGRTGKIRCVERTRVLVGNATYIVIDALDVDGRAATLDVRGDQFVEVLAPVSDDDVLDVLGLLADGDTAYFTRFDGGLYA